MTLAIVIDMNLPPAWVDVLNHSGHSAVHWSSVGRVMASDAEIMGWARRNNHVVFTHDLDFSALLALTHGSGPSVVQLRGQDTLPGTLAVQVVDAISRYESELRQGAILTIDINRARLRLLPL